MLDRNQEFGTLTDGRTLRLERLLPGPIERVWAYLTDPAKRRLWLAAGDTIGEKGAHVAFVWNNAHLSRADDLPPPEYAGANQEHSLVCVVTDYDPPHRLSFTWGEAKADASEVTFELEPAGERVRFVLTHSRLPDAGFRLSVSSGWHAHVAMLVAELEGEPAESFWSLHKRLKADYAARIGDMPL